MPVEIPSGPARYCAGYKYQLQADLLAKLPLTGEQGCVDGFLELKPDGTLTVKAGYAWDGASGPALDTPSAIRGSLIHDALYQLMREGFLPQSCREIADRILVEVCRMDGMDPLRAAGWYAAVREFGRPSAARCDRATYVAPPLEAPR